MEVEPANRNHQRPSCSSSWMMAGRWRCGRGRHRVHPFWNISVLIEGLNVAGPITFPAMKEIGFILRCQMSDFATIANVFLGDVLPMPGTCSGWLKLKAAWASEKIVLVWAHQKPTHKTYQIVFSMFCLPSTTTWMKIAPNSLLRAGEADCTLLRVIDLVENEI